MKSTQWLLVLVAVVGLGALYFGFGGDAGYTGTEPVPEAVRSIGDFDASAVEKIRVSKDDFAIEIVRNEDGWVVPASWNYPAKSGAVDQLVEAVSAVGSAERRAKEKSSHARFGIDERTRWEVTVEGSGDDLPKTLHVADNRSQRDRSYVKLPEDDVIYSVTPSLLVRGGLGWNKNKIDPWLDLKLATRSSSEPDVTRIEMRNGDTEVVLERSPAVEEVVPDPDPAAPPAANEPEWRVIAPEEFVADVATASSLVTKSRLIEGVAACAPTPLDEYGLDAPARSVRFTMEDGETFRIDIGRALAEGDEGHTPNEEKFYATRENDPRVVVLSARTVEGLFRSVDELRPQPESQPSTP